MRLKKLLKKLPDYLGYLVQAGTVANVVTTALGINPFGVAVMSTQLGAVVSSTIIKDKHLPKGVNLLAGNFGRAENDVFDN